MAKALECPACGAKHRLDGLEPSTTFRCEQCGQTLKVPASIAAVRAEANGVPDLSRATSGATSTVPPPPRRNAPGTSATREIVGVSAIATSTVDENGDTPSSEKRSRRKRERRPSGTPRRRVHWYWRIVAWVVAVPLGFVITAWPAYELNLIKKDDVLDVFVGSGTGRYTRLAIGTLVWALVTALLVQLFIEGGRVWSDRRRRRREASAVRSTRGARSAGVSG